MNAVVMISMAVTTAAITPMGLICVNVMKVINYNQITGLVLVSSRE